MRLRKSTERRNKMRFPMTRELRYKLLEDERIMAVGLGSTTNVSSGGIAFHSNMDLPSGSFIELSISWPALLGDACPMRLIVFGRVLRGSGPAKVCTVEKWEFRTQARQVAASMPLRIDGKLQRWAEYRKEIIMRTSPAAAAAAGAPA
jgi:hypothetical protein